MWYVCYAYLLEFFKLNSAFCWQQAPPHVKLSLKHDKKSILLFFYAKMDNVTLFKKILYDLGEDKSLDKAES